MNAAELFAKMDENFNADAAIGIDAVFQYEFSDDDNYYIAIKEGTKDIQQGNHESPSVTIASDSATFLGIIDGSINGMQTFMSGKLKVTGNIMLAQKINTFFAI